MSPDEAQAVARKAAAVLDPAVEFLADEWTQFFQGTADNGTPLIEHIKGFSAVAFGLAEARFTELRGLPDAALAFVVSLAVVRSGTHSRAEVEAAVGAPLPG